MTATTTPMVLSEDDIYRTSSQYRLWSFAPEALASLRRQTHELAVERTRKNHSPRSLREDEILTEREELNLVLRYCEQLRVTSDHLKFIPAVKVTAIQYLKRFYLSNSVLTYPPKEIYKTVLFLASKTEGTHTKLSDYAPRIKTKPEVILAPEFKVMQALRFTLEVKQPSRGSKGVLMDLLSMAAAEDEKDQTTALAHVDAPEVNAKTRWKHSGQSSINKEDLKKRIHQAYAAMRELLDGPCLLTDVCFLYTPSQIVLASLYLADPPLATRYLEVKLGDSSINRAKILATVHSCVQMISSFSETLIMSKDERAELEDRLEICRDPTTKNLVENHLASKRGDSDDEDAKITKRKTERENHINQGNDLFGLSLVKG